MKVFFKLTWWKIISALILYYLVNWVTIIYLGGPYYNLLFSCNNILCNFVKVPPLAYIFIQLPNVAEMMIAYALACTVVWYIQQKAVLEAQEKQKNLQSAKKEEAMNSDITNTELNTKQNEK